MSAAHAGLSWRGGTLTARRLLGSSTAASDREWPVDASVAGSGACEPSPMTPSFRGGTRTGACDEGWLRFPFLLGLRGSVALLPAAWAAATQAPLPPAAVGAYRRQESLGVFAELAWAPCTLDLTAVDIATEA